MTGTAPANRGRIAPDPTGNAELAEALARWLPRRRWFADKDRLLTGVRILHAPAVSGPHAERTGVLAVVRAEFEDTAGPSDYLVPLAIGPVRRTLPGAADSLVARLRTTEFTDALAEPGFAAALVRRTALGGCADGLAFVPEGPGFAPPGPGAPERVLTVQQSNTSVVVGDRHLIKFFRRPAPGVNPELDALRLLRAGASPDVPGLEGAVHGPLGAATATYAVVQEFVPDSEDGWTLALRSARAEREGRADGFAASLAQLGSAVARVHAVLAAQGEVGALDRGVLSRLAREMAGRLDGAIALAPELAGRREAIAAVYAALGQATPRPGGLIQRVHGDLHLGQALRAGQRWYVVDFEGEPAAPFARRTAAHPPERDVAGMLRSIDYAAEHGAAAGWPGGAWAGRAERAFLAGYRAAAGLGPEESLLTAYQIDKAVYELCYELRHRPSWAPIARSGLKRLLGDAGAPPGNTLRSLCANR
ncbi:hypothetical protein KDK95_32580 [Actinospica sp. MGRD01-02]|uniref:Maltokinase n=1 Tax=Actinospica acidithermotolerans TaxID=2828514 RepID=A0A941IMH1_9ACTN|nr:hypothetical protein [Actinospica acidithermotolerans]MBR7831087.1 hypothetical protein [Actinospica acidithermotolerans]